ncbi:MAG: choline-glycine betaine transporter [Candidatus Omnitrophota bacterium]|jgi:choline-glycine betaine transporter
MNYCIKCKSYFTKLQHTCSNCNKKLIGGVRKTILDIIHWIGLVLVIGVCLVLGFYAVTYIDKVFEEDASKARQQMQKMREEAKEQDRYSRF